MKYGKRIAAFALAMTIAFGSVCYRPPKAEAIVGLESFYISAVCSSYMSSIGYSLSTDNQQAINEAFVEQIGAFCTDVYDAYNQTEEQIYGILQSGATIVKNGVIQLSHEACDVLKRFSDWLIEKLGLTSGSDAVISFPSSADGFYVLDGMTGELGAECKFSQIVYTDGDPYVIKGTNFAEQDLPVDRYLQSDSQYIKYLYMQGTSPNYRGIDFICWKDSASGKNLYIENTRGDYIIRDDVGQQLIFTDLTTDGSGYHRLLNPTYFPYADYAWMLDFFGIEVDVGISLSPEYEEAPTVEEQYAMVIDTGMTFEDEQAMIDQVLGGIAAGTLSPTYTVEKTTAGDVTVPGEDTEDDTPASILSWTKKIWQSVTELPDTIARAVAEVFVPSEEYMTALPDTITATFDNRTGFLTYPATLMYDFGNMLSKGAADFILVWPEIRVPPSNALLMDDGAFNVSKFVRDNDDLAMVYELYQFVVSAYLTFLFLGLCRRKYNSVIGDRLEG